MSIHLAPCTTCGTCPDCDGYGYTSRTWDPAIDGYWEDTCSTCNGTGDAAEPTPAEVIDQLRSELLTAKLVASTALTYARRAKDDLAESTAHAEEYRTIEGNAGGFGYMRSIAAHAGDELGRIVDTLTKLAG